MILALLALAQASGGELPPVGQAAAQQTPADECSGKLYEGFDFWLGRWNVFVRESGEPLGQSQVEKINNGCAVRETWLPLQGKAGGTLNAPDLITGRWHQYWVDKAGTRVDLEGGLFNGNMVLSGAWQRGGESALLRITYSRLDRDSVRQLAEFSTDDGLTWETSFDHLYLRVVPAD